MSISNASDVTGGLREELLFTKAYGGNIATGFWLSLWATGSLPAAGSYVIGNTTSGVVPTDATTGVPVINFSSTTGRLLHSEFITTASGRFFIYDRLWHVGSFTSSATTFSLTSQPSFSSRVPGGTDYTGTMLFLELTNAWSFSPTLTFTYTNAVGTTGRSTSFTIPGARNTDFVFQVPLASGDRGIQRLDSISSTGLGGTFNVFIARPLLYSKMILAHVPQVSTFGSGLPFTQVFQDSAIALLASPNSTAAFTVAGNLTVVSN